MALDPVERVEDDHPLLDRDVELVEAPLLAGAAAEDLQVCVRHPILRQWALLPSRLRSWSDIAGRGVLVTVIEPSGPRPTTTLTWPQAPSSVAGKSSRLWAPRLSVRSRALRVMASEIVSRWSSSKTRFQPGL